MRRGKGIVEDMVDARVFPPPHTPLVSEHRLTHGSCGRAIKGPHKDHEPEPPDRPETETVFASKPISEAAILDDDLD